MKPEQYTIWSQQTNKQTIKQTSKQKKSAAIFVMQLFGKLVFIITIDKSK